jgi:hypothetical protein
MGFLTQYGYQNGKVGKLMAPLDADNNFCGQDELKNYPLLYITNFDSLSITEIFSSSVCVSKCPQDEDD